MLADIQTETDIKLFVDIFYQKLLEDKKINHYFIDLDLNAHLPNVYSFWSMILLGTSLYKENMMVKHKMLDLKSEDFDIWLGHFTNVLDSLFQGDKMEEAKSRAKTIALTMKYKFLAPQDEIK